VTNLRRRLKKLEAGRVDARGLVPYSQKWFEYWYKQFDLYAAGELNVVLFPAEIISGWIAQDSDFDEALD
jgi:hypothetical protein